LLLEHPILFLSGKGGVGKTTVAALVALSAARAGSRTLLVSIDPAHNLRDVFDIRLPASGIRTLAPMLDVLEIDPESECRRYINGVKSNMRSLVRSDMVEEAERQLDLAALAPGATEAAMLERVMRVLLDERDCYDRVIFDTSPTGHTLRLLAMPEMMTIWVSSLVRRRRKHNLDRSRWLGQEESADDAIVQLLHRRHDRLAATRDLLEDPRLTAFAFVLLPEALPIAETRRGIEELKAVRLGVSALVINQLLPEYVTEPFFHRRLERQRRYLEEIDRKLAGYPQLRLPLLDQDVSSPEALDCLLEYFSQVR
jgi:arsenite-transporting ATPase